MQRSKSFLAVMLILWVVPAFGQNNNKLLPAAAPFTLQQINPNVSANIKLKVNTYKSGPMDTLADTANVLCPNMNGQNIGQLKFSYGTYTGDFTGGNANSFGGAIINGGFIANKNCQLPAGSSYGWLQYIDVTSANMPPDETTHRVDSPGPGPIYPDFTQNNAYAKNYTAVLFDAPGRGNLGAGGYTNLTWLAQSALVCYNSMAKTAMVIGSFTWGFTITTAGNVTSVNPTAPSAFDSTAATDNTFITKLNKSKDPALMGWTLSTGCCCVPEFGMTVQFSFVILGLFLVMRRSRHTSAHVAA